MSVVELVICAGTDTALTVAMSVVELVICAGTDTALTVAMSVGQLAISLGLVDTAVWSECARGDSKGRWGVYDCGC